MSRNGCGRTRLTPERSQRYGSPSRVATRSRGRRPAMAGPLDGIVRILDIPERSPAAAIAGMVLADLGAEVIRVEPEGGDPVRALPGSRVWLREQKSEIGRASCRERV